MTIKQKLLIQTVLLAIVPAFIVALIITLQANQASFVAMEKKTEQRLTSLRELKKSQINAYLNTIEQQVITFSNNPAIKDAANKFAINFEQASINENQYNTNELSSYYQSDFTNTFKEKNSSTTPDILGKYTQLSDKARHFQNKYIALNQYPLGNKDKLVSAGNSPYDKTHSKYHPVFKDYLERFGYYDIFIVDAKSGHIVYSVFKELDFATSLNTGPYANSGIAKAFKQSLLTNNESTLIDFDSYFPSYDQAASFIASPIKSDNGSVDAVLIFQMPIDGINAIMTNNQHWKDVGLGLSGETYLVGPDNTLRSESRFLIEDRSNYIKALEQSKEQTNVQRIKDYNSALGLQYVNTEGAFNALKGNKGYGKFNDYRNVEVLSAYTPIKYGNKSWALLAEIDSEEAYADAIALTNDMYRYMIISLLIIGVLSISIGLYVSKLLVAPLNTLVKRITDISEGDGDLTVELDLAKRKDEIGEVGRSFNNFVKQIRDIIADIDHHATQLASSSEELSAVTNETNDVVSKQKHKTDSTSNYMSSLSSNINDIADNSGITANLTNQANSESTKGANLSQDAQLAINELVGSVNSASTELNQLNGQVEQISEILTVIDSIADQTNLLALNAAIEAARAGESGRGFSVVADEVRTLAAKTQESTVEIQKRMANLKESSQKSVFAMQSASNEANKGIVLVQETADSLKTVATLVADVSERNAANASVAKMQSTNVDDVHQNIIDIANYTENTSSASLQTHQASNELAKLAVNMSSIVNQFKY